jgi:hypothetical protein
MKTIRILLLGISVSLVCSAGRVFAATPVGCTPNGNIFNLESTVNNLPSSALGTESIAFLLNGSGNGNDLILGAASDPRKLVGPVTLSSFSSDAFYIGRDRSDCGASVDGGVPNIPLTGPPNKNEADSGGPAVAADPAHNALFLADTYFISDSVELGIVRASAADLLNTTNCPSSTLQSNASRSCFSTSGGLTAPVGVFLLDQPTIAVDQRTSGVGSGDVYAATIVDNSNTDQPFMVGIFACTNATLNCSSNFTLVGVTNDPQSDDQDPYVQVRSDGDVTLTYTDTEQVQFVTCTPQGAPTPPKCSAPVDVPQPTFPSFGEPGETGNRFGSLVTHVNRREPDGSFTTFVVQQQCDVFPAFDVCAKASVVVTFSTDEGETWSPLEKITDSPGQQFQPVMAIDESTQTINIAYYSTQNQGQPLQKQLFLAQILPGTTTAAAPHQLTSTFFAGGIGLNIGIAAAGTGTAGQSRVYVHYNYTPVPFIFGTIGFPINTNTLTRFDY